MNKARISELMKLEDVSRYATYRDFLDANLYHLGVTITTPFKDGIAPVFCDIAASSFPLKCITNFLTQNVYPYYTNTHSNNFFGRIMSEYCANSKRIIMECVGGDCKRDKILFSGSGSTGGINHLVHMILPIVSEAVVIVSDLEHLSNYLPWYHAAKKLCVVETNEYNVIDLGVLEETIRQNQQFKKLIVSVTHCSNVLGSIQPVHRIATLVHKYSGYMFVDYSASAPYVSINMNRDVDKGQYFDGIFLSPHKFYGGQGGPGILVVKAGIVCNRESYTPGGSTCRVNTYAHGPVYNRDIEVSEQGGTPNIIGTVAAALAMRAKYIFKDSINAKCKYISNKVYEQLKRIEADHPGSFILLNKYSAKYPRHLPIFAFSVPGYHYNYIVALLNDLYGITSRGGLSCSAVLIEKKSIRQRLHTNVQKSVTKLLEDKGVDGTFGWVRISFGCHLSDAQIEYVIRSLRDMLNVVKDYQIYYEYDPKTNVYLSNVCTDHVCTTAYTSFEEF